MALEKTRDRTTSLSHLRCNRSSVGGHLNYSFRSAEIYVALNGQKSQGYSKAFCLHTQYDHDESNPNQTENQAKPVAGKMLYTIDPNSTRYFAPQCIVPNLVRLLSYITVHLGHLYRADLYPIFPVLRWGSRKPCSWQLHSTSTGVALM